MTMEHAPYHDVIITAANDSQAHGYRAELRSRSTDGRLPEGVCFHVIADPGDRRVGSGAATLASLDSLARTHRTTTRALVESRRILILHSGGDSKRLPAYAAHGKLFLPLPRRDDRGRNIALFDLLLHDLSTPRVRDRGRVVIAAGDLYLSLEQQALSLDGDDYVGVAFRGAAETGTRHGVYVVRQDGKVSGFLQKPSIAEAGAARAVDPEGFVLVDTGVVSLSSRAILMLRSAANAGGRASLFARAISGASPAVDLYEHLLIGLFASTTPDRYAAALGKDPAHRASLLAFKERLSHISSRVEVAPNCRFLHIGTTRELLERLGPGFGDPSSRAERVCFNSFAPRGIASRGTSIVEGCTLHRRASLGGDNVLVGVPAEFRSPISLPRGVGLAMLPVGTRDWAVILFGDRDDFKTPFSRAGTFLNRAVPSDVDGGTTLWDAALWFVGPLSRSYSHAMTVLRKGWATDPSLRPMSWLMANVNHDRLLASHHESARLGRLAEIPARMLAHNWLATRDLVIDTDTPGEALAAARLLHSSAADCTSTARARLLHASSRMLERAGRTRAAVRTAEVAFDAVRQSVRTAAAKMVFPAGPAILRDQVVWATCPARIDLSGGWSDTPPICTDLGGAVVNAAVTMNGQYPLQAICRLIDEPVIRLNSIDLGRTITYRNADHLRRFGDPTDWAALPKAALLLTGFVPGRDRTLARHLGRFGAGLDITVFSALPKGSGMGSSSILGAALLAALLRVLGEDSSHTRIIELTSALEQLMSTGGGWQDQAGGIVPGVKLLTTEPGPHQIPTVGAIPNNGALAGPEAAARCLLFFTGQRRLAKNILRNVVSGYLDREPRVRGVIERLKHGALELDSVLRTGTLDDVAAGIAAYWECKKLLDPGSTNAEIERLLAGAQRWLSGFSLLGAGGGGFAFLVAKDERAAKRVRSTLERERGASVARFYDFAIDTQGLNVSTL